MAPMRRWSRRGDTTSGNSHQREARAYIYTDRPVYRPGHTVHIKAVVRVKKGDALELPQGMDAHA